MKLHANAKTCPAARLLLCRRVIEENRTLTGRVPQVIALPNERLTGAEIAERLKMALATVASILRGAGLPQPTGRPSGWQNSCSTTRRVATARGSSPDRPRDCRSTLGTDFATGSRAFVASCRRSVGGRQTAELGA